MDNFSCQRHTIPIRISQLTVLNYKFKHSKKKMQKIQTKKIPLILLLLPNNMN